MTARLKKARRGREHAGCIRHCLYLLMCFARVDSKHILWKSERGCVCSLPTTYILRCAALVHRGTQSPSRSTIRMLPRRPRSPDRLCSLPRSPLVPLSYLPPPRPPPRVAVLPAPGWCFSAGHRRWTPVLLPRVRVPGGGRHQGLEIQAGVWACTGLRPVCSVTAVRGVSQSDTRLFPLFRKRLAEPRE